MGDKGRLFHPLPNNTTTIRPPDDCQELLNGWHNFSFELMDVVGFILGLVVGRMWLGRDVSLYPPSTPPIRPTHSLHHHGLHPKLTGRCSG